MYRDGLPVNEDMRPVDMDRYLDRSPVAWSRLRAHHYWSRSEEERRRKAELWRESGSSRSLPRAPLAERAIRSADDTLARYAPAVREALARRGKARR